jgi:hypothetical protein
VVRRFAGDNVRFVIVVLELPPLRRGKRREPVECTRVSVIDAASLPDDATGSDWLRRASVGVEADELARLLAYHRVAAADPYAPDFDPSRALAIRIGYGSGAQLAAGEWTEARPLEVPAPAEPKRRSKHRPADRLAALLSGRDAVLACEELTLRARADLDLGRNHEAAVQLEAALSAALSELAGWVGVGDLAARLDALRALQAGVSSAADAARSGTMDAAAVEVVSAAQERLEAALRARAIYGAE